MGTLTATQPDSPDAPRRPRDEHEPPTPCGTPSIRNWKQSYVPSDDTRYLNETVPATKFAVNCVAAMRLGPESGMALDFRLHAPRLEDSLLETLQPVNTPPGVTQPAGRVQVGGQVSLVPVVTSKLRATVDASA